MNALLDAPEEIRGTILGVHYAAESRWAVFTISLDGVKPSSPGVATVTGDLPSSTTGTTVMAMGSWINHPKHGPQFKAA